MYSSPWERGNHCSSAFAMYSGVPVVEAGALVSSLVAFVPDSMKVGLSFPGQFLRLTCCQPASRHLTCCHVAHTQKDHYWK